MRAVFKDDSSQVHFRYDAAGNRIAKITESDTTIYVRDASGNVMATYKNDTLIEQSIYGSSQLGLMTASSKAGYRTLGGKKYELSNHLGNVLAVVTDNIHLDQDSTWASVVNVTDYYPFGLAMDGRSVQDSSYRYGFNGKEEDSAGEWGGQSHYDYGFRIYNPSIAKFLSVDPLTGSYPMLTPYQFASNTPIYAFDLDGLEMLPGYFDYILSPGTAMLKKFNDTGVRVEGWERVHKIIHKKEPDIFDKVGYYTEAFVYNFGEYTEVKDVSVLFKGETVSGESANTLDYTFATGGLFIPFVSGGALKKTLKNFYRIMDGPKADKFFVKHGVENFTEFRNKFKDLPTGERVAAYMEAGEVVATRNGWKKNNKLSSRNERTVYDTEFGHAALDTEKGTFEIVNKKGRHQGEVNFEGTKIEDRDKSKGHDLIVK